MLAAAARVFAISMMVLLVADGLGDDLPQAAVKERYRVPSLIIVTHVDWPKDSQHWDAMAEFVRGNGFNVVEGNLELLDVCRRHGLMAQLGSEPEVLAAAPKLKDDPAVFGYFVSDRRRRHAFPGFAKTAREFEQADPNHPTIFINRANWNEFTAFAEEVKPLLLDFYHYHGNPREHPDRYYVFLAMFRSLGQQHGIPVIRCTASNDPPAFLRMTMYSSLAYGVKGFHFWPPWICAHEKDKDGNALLKDGKLKTYVTIPALPEIAKEIRLMSPALTDCRSVAIYHADPLPIGGEKAPADAWCRPEGADLLVGVFQNGKNEDYLLVVNRHSGEKREAALSFDKGVTAVAKMDKKNGQWEVQALENAGDRKKWKLMLAEGDGELLKIDRAR